MKNSNKDKQDFHAVEFMRQVRNELTELFLKDFYDYFLIVENYFHAAILTNGVCLFTTAAIL